MQRFFLLRDLSIHLLVARVGQNEEYVEKLFPMKLEPEDPPLLRYPSSDLQERG